MIIYQLKVIIEVSYLQIVCIHLRAEVIEVNVLFPGEGPVKVSYIFPNGDRYGE